MKYKVSAMILSAGLILSGCDQTTRQTNNNEIVTERFIHRYGYDVSKSEWEAKDYPGQVITTYRNGVTVVTNFEDGQIHGFKTTTYPHSQTLEIKETYQRGTLTKRTSFDLRGIPVKEEHFLAPDHVKVLFWYSNGTPRATEDYRNDQLNAAEYYTMSNETEAKIENGSGIRVLRNAKGQILSKEYLTDYELTKKETFHLNGTPEMTVHYKNGLLEGEKLVHAETGEPISKEVFKDGVLDGIAVYFQNGYRFLESTYSSGRKDGLEKHYIDGDVVAEESNWKNNLRHGPTQIFFDGMVKTHWYYNNERVSKSKYDDLTKREEEIAQLQERAENSKSFTF
jgi:antitoxin component YwqK of YwqJK toxin-antitoxin module